MDRPETIQTPAPNPLQGPMPRRFSDDDGDGGMIGRALIYAVIVLVGVGFFLWQRLLG